MSKALFSAWKVFDFAPGPYPERLDVADNWLDRLLGHLLGNLSNYQSIFEISRLKRFARRCEGFAAVFDDQTDEALKLHISQLRMRLVRSGLDRDISAEIFALVREVTGRQLGMRHYPTQLMGGYVLLQGTLAEMRTGEGKTLTALLPAVAVALTGIPVHVITVNEYLASRDAEFLRPVYEFFGLSVGLVQPEQEPAERRQAYNHNVTYCINKDLVFDYLKDKISTNQDPTGARRAVSRFFGQGQSASPTTLRGLFFGIVDEADSVLIDEARTPLIISESIADPHGEELYQMALLLAEQLFADVDYQSFPKDRSVQLTPQGVQHLSELCSDLSGVWAVKRARRELIQQALCATLMFERDKHYIIADGKVEIVDEYTGRVMPDRSWERGLHQMIEIKEGCSLTDLRDTISKVTFQRFFRRYLRLSGMTGTATEVSGELRAVYGLKVVRIPTHRPVIRRNLGVRVFFQSNDRWQAVVSSVKKYNQQGRPVLIGTRSVSTSELLSDLLKGEGLDHEVLNARQDQLEADIVTRAGRKGAITVATNMAGRGTDIKLDRDVIEIGGLHVIMTEFHESARIDRQLYGRCSRQGDPGSYEALVALQDELFDGYVKHYVAWIKNLSVKRIELSSFLACFLKWKAQSSAERHHAIIRKQTMQHDKQLDSMLAFAGRGE